MIVTRRFKKGQNETYQICRSFDFSIKTVGEMLGHKIERDNINV